MSERTEDGGRTVPFDSVPKLLQNAITGFHRLLPDIEGDTPFSALYAIQTGVHNGQVELCRLRRERDALAALKPEGGTDADER